MNLSTTAALAALALGCSAPVCAWDGWSGEPALRLPGEQSQDTSPSLKLRTWAHDLSDRLAVIARPQLPELQWRGEGVSAPAVRPQADHPWLVERTRAAQRRSRVGPGAGADRPAALKHPPRRFASPPPGGGAGRPS